MDPVLLMLRDGSIKMYDQPDIRAAQVLLEFPGQKLTCCPGTCEHPPVPFATVLKPGATYHLSGTAPTLDLRGSPSLSPRGLSSSGLIGPPPQSLVHLPIRGRGRTASFSFVDRRSNSNAHPACAHLSPYDDSHDAVEFAPSSFLQQRTHSHTDLATPCHVAEDPSLANAAYMRLPPRPHAARASGGRSGPLTPRDFQISPSMSQGSTYHSCMCELDRAAPSTAWLHRTATTTAMHADKLQELAAMTAGSTQKAPSPSAPFVGMDWLDGARNLNDRRDVSARYDLIDLDSFDFEAYQERHQVYFSAPPLGFNLPTNKAPPKKKPLASFFRRASAKLMRRSRTDVAPRATAQGEAGMKSQSARHESKVQEQELWNSLSSSNRH